MQPIFAQSYTGNGFALNNTQYLWYSEQSAVRNTFIGGDTYQSSLYFHSPVDSIALTLQKSNLWARHSNASSGLQFQLYSSLHSATVQYTRQFDFAAISTGVTAATANNEQLINYSAQLRFCSNSSLVNGYTLVLSRQTIPVSFLAEYESETLQLINPLTINSVTHQYQTEGKSLSFSILYTKNYGLSDNLAHDNKIDNNVNYSRILATVSHRSQNVTVTASAENDYFSGDLLLSHENLSFGYCTVNNFNYYRVSAGCSAADGESSEYNLKAEYYWLSASMIGSIESWPFTSVVNSLFLNRAYFRIAAKASALSIQSEYRYKKNGLTVTPELSFTHINPAITVETWQPEFLVFGVKNFFRNQFEITGIGFAAVSCSASYQKENFTVAAEIMQLAPLYIHKRLAQTTTPTPQPPGPAAKKTTRDGGRTVSFSVRWDF